MADDGPPELFSDPPISVESASRLIADLGFVAFRTHTEAQMPESCVMVMLRTAPTLRHFDPEVASFWVNDEHHGRIDFVDVDTRVPLSRSFSWGRIRLVDRFGMRNSFVSFGGTLHAQRVGSGATLLVFRSAAPILRLRGHSQRSDPMADEALAFFGRIVPRLWDDSDLERVVAASGADALYAAFLLHSSRRLGASRVLRDSIRDDALLIARALAELATYRAAAVAAGRLLIEKLGLAAWPER